jgi:hypothetical protein
MLLKVTFVNYRLQAFSQWRLKQNISNTFITMAARKGATIYFAVISYFILGGYHVEDLSESAYTNIKF